MGVKICSRKGCEEIMCSTYTSEGYVCFGCKEEFSSLQEDADFDSIDKAFKNFMATNKIENKPTGNISVKEYFDLHD